MSTGNVSLDFSDMNLTCPLSLQWNQSIMDIQEIFLYVCIIALISHSLFWLQLILYPTLRQKSMQWLYSYLATDILILIRFFFTFVVHTKSTECIPNKIWFLIVCYLEALIDNYLNTIEIYILLALNICRYIQIAYNKNVYTTYVRLLMCTHLIIYLIPLIIFIIELLVGWAELTRFVGDSCDISYKNQYVQTINIIFGLALPIILNLFVIYCNIRHVNMTARLRQTQHRISARDKYNRSLIIQFIVFYTVWFFLWSPNIIISQFTSYLSQLTVIGLLLNYIEIILDPIIIAALDVRFQKVWRKLWADLRKISIYNQANQRRVAPLATPQEVWSISRRVQHATSLIRE